MFKKPVGSWLSVGNKKSSLEWLESLEKVGWRENFNTLMQAHLCEVRIT